MFARFSRRDTAFAAPRLQIEHITELLVNQSVYDALMAGEDPRRIAQDWLEGLEKFEAIRKKYLIY